MNQDNCRILLGILALFLIISLFTSGFLYSRWIAAETGQNSLESVAELQGLLLRVQGNVSGVLHSMDEATTEAARELTETGLTGDEAESILNRTSKATPYVIDCITVDPKGIILAIEPEQYKGVIGENIGNQIHFVRLSRERIPVMSGMIPTVEGIPAVDIASPVFSTDGLFIGATTALISPGDLFADQMSGIQDRAGYDFSVMQTNGLIIYDTDAMQVGRVLFDDPFFEPYPSLIDFGRQVAASEAGYGMYSFLDRSHERNVTKQAYWSTAGIRGTEWRLVISKEVQ
ncbi:MAG: cache domain-containing protein [Methanoregulaceae archaeon]|nr:cache domain-containing protein [Methanoregulaceae archaeon]